jgi:hypothetical protein
MASEEVRFKCLTFDEAVEAIRYEDEMTQTGVGAIVRLALGDEDADLAAEYDQLLEAINFGHEPEEEAEA